MPASELDHKQGKGQAKVPLFLKDDFAKSTLVRGDLDRSVIKCPELVDCNEWIAAHVFDFRNLLMLFVEILDYVHRDNPCAEMIVGDAQAVASGSYGMPANLWIKQAVTDIQTSIDDVEKFPTRAGIWFASICLTDDDCEGIPFPQGFLQDIVHPIAEKIFYILTHIYYVHADLIADLGLEAHLNTFFSHFIIFGRRFELLAQDLLVQASALIKAIVQAAPAIDSSGLVEDCVAEFVVPPDVEKTDSSVLADSFRSKIDLGTGHNINTSQL